MVSRGQASRGFCAMHNAQDTTEVWRAAQHRGTNDIGNWLGSVVKPPAIEIGRWVPLKLHGGLIQGLTVATVAFLALGSVSAAVHAGKTHHIVIRATGPMPAVNVP
jgi:hypothetical protein